MFSMFINTPNEKRTGPSCLCCVAVAAGHIVPRPGHPQSPRHATLRHVTLTARWRSKLVKWKDLSLQGPSL